MEQRQVIVEAAYPSSTEKEIQDEIRSQYDAIVDEQTSILWRRFLEKLKTAEEMMEEVERRAMILVNARKQR